MRGVVEVWTRCAIFTELRSGCAKNGETPTRVSPSIASYASFASMRLGPDRDNASRIASANASAESTVRAGTPNPSANSTHRIAGSAMFVSLRDASPGAPTRCIASSSFSMAYVALAHTTVTTSRRSRACVHSACGAYRPLPSA